MLYIQLFHLDSIIRYQSSLSVTVHLKCSFDTKSNLYNLDQEFVLPARVAAKISSKTPRNTKLVPSSFRDIAPPGSQDNVYPFSTTDHLLLKALRTTPGSPLCHAFHEYIQLYYKHIVLSYALRE